MLPLKHKLAPVKTCCNTSNLQMLADSLLLHYVVRCGLAIDTVSVHFSFAVY